MEKEAATLISSFYRRSRNRQIILAGAATVIQRAWRQSQQRFVDRCMEITRTRIEGALVIQRWWARMQSSRRQNEILREQQASSEEPTAVTDITKTEMNSERGVKSNPFSLCDFRIEMFSPALDIGSFLSWGNYAEQEIEVAITDKYLSASFEIASSGESISRSQKILLRNLEGQEEFRQSVSATLIASAWKGYHCRKKYLDIIHRRRLWLRGQAVLAIQQAWSCYQKRCFEHRQATRIQCIWRMHAQRSEFVAMQWLRALCARQIQCTWRMSRARGEFLKARAAAVVIQDMVRTVQNRKVAAIKLQRVWRLYMLTHKKGTSSSRSRLLFSVPAMVVQAGLAWVLSDPRVIEFALRGGN